MSPSSSSRADGMWLVVGVLAVLLAMAECVGAVILVNRPGVADAIGLPDWGVTLVTAGAIVIMAVLAASALIGIAPRSTVPRSIPAR
jgi:hypothetical protein